MWNAKFDTQETFLIINVENLFLETHDNVFLIYYYYYYYYYFIDK